MNSQIYDFLKFTPFSFTKLGILLIVTTEI